MLELAGMVGGIHFVCKQHVIAKSTWALLLWVPALCTLFTYGSRTSGFDLGHNHRINP